MKWSTDPYRRRSITRSCLPTPTVVVAENGLKLDGTVKAPSGLKHVEGGTADF